MKRGLFFLDGRNWQIMRRKMNPILLKNSGADYAHQRSKLITDNLIRVCSKTMLTLFVIFWPSFYIWLKLLCLVTRVEFWWAIQLLHLVNIVFEYILKDLILQVDSNKQSGGLRVDLEPLLHKGPFIYYGSKGLLWWGIAWPQFKSYI